MEEDEQTTFLLIVRPEPGVDAIRALRAWLKTGLRILKLRCVGIQEIKQQRRMKMDMRKFSPGVIRPEDLYDGPRVEKIINIFEHEKHKCAVFEFESGDQFYCWPNYARILNKAWGYDSNGWIKQELELSLGHYTDKRSDPPEEKETIVVKPLSPRKADASNGGAPITASLPASRTAPTKDELDDEVPF
jgi:hypothetical protein